VAVRWQKSMCLAAKGWLQGRAAKLLRARRKSRCNEDLGKFALQLTARQYGEVVLPDAASGHDPDTLATKLSRCAPHERSEQRGCKEGMSSCKT